MSDKAARLDGDRGGHRRAPAVRRLEICNEATNLVPGEGNPDADVVFVGEAPGASEDKQGRPFVGNAGRLLDGLLAEAGLERDAGLHHERRQGAPAEEPRPEARRGRATTCRG